MSIQLIRHSASRRAVRCIASDQGAGGAAEFWGGIKAFGFDLLDRAGVKYEVRMDWDQAIRFADDVKAIQAKVERKEADWRHAWSQIAAKRSSS